MAAPLIPIALALAKEFLPGIAGKITNSKEGERIAEAVVTTAIDVTGAGTANAALAALKSNPDKVIEYQARAYSHEEVIARIQADDRAGARSRDVELRKVSRWGNWRADVLALAAVVLLWRIIELLVSGKVPSDGGTRDVIMYLFAAVVLMVKDVYQFEFGSSRGSKDKDRPRLGADD